MKKLDKKTINKFLLTIIVILGTCLFFLICNDKIHTYTQSKAIGTETTTITQDKKISQTFVSGVDNLKEIKIKFGTYQKKLSSRTINIKVKNGNEIIREDSIKSEEIYDNQYTTFRFEPIEDTKDKTITVDIECETCQEGELAVFYSKSTPNVATRESLTTDQILLGNSLEMKLVGKNYAYGYIILLTILFLLAIASYAYFNQQLYKKKVEKIITLINKYHLFYIIEFILSAVLVVCIYKLVYISSYQYTLSIRYYLIFLLTAILMIGHLLTRDFKKIKLESIFLILVIPISLGYLFFMTPLSVADETAHYSTAYQISKGTLINILPGEIPTNLKNNRATNYYKLDQLLKLENDNNLLSTCRIVRYSPLVYFPSAVGLYIGNILNLNATISFYIARVFNLLVFLITGYIGIKILPIGKLVLFVYLLNPMMIHQAISLSADSIINSLCLLLICYSLYLMYKKEKLTNKNLLLLGLIMIATASVKYVYIVLLLLPIFMLMKKHKTLTKTQKIIILITIILSLITWVGIYVYGKYDAKKLDPNYDYSVISDKPDEHNKEINSSKQLHFLLENPQNLVSMLYYTTINNTPFYLTTFLGQSLGELNINVNLLISVSYLLILVFSVISQKEKKTYEKIPKLLMISIVIIEYGAIITGMSLQWTSVGNLIAEGVQGRYFLPVMILLLLALIPKNNSINIKNKELKFSALLVAIHSATIATIICNFI